MRNQIFAYVVGDPVSWMIEARYAIVPFVMLLALRRPDGDVWERVTLVVWAILSLWLAWHVFDQRFML